MTPGAMADTDVNGTAAPIFVVGLDRSGTTLTARILDRHSRIGMCGESHFLHRTAKLDITEPLADPDAHAILDRLRMDWIGVEADAVMSLFRRTDRSLKDLFDSMLRARMRRTGKVRCGEKTPNHFWYLDRLFAWYPDARVIYLVRDPRRLHASFERSGFRLSIVDRWVIPRALYWSFGARQLRRAQRDHPGRVLDVGFEELIRAPEATARKICAFLGEPFEPRMLEVEENNSSFDDLGPGAGVRTEVLERPLGLSRWKIAMLELFSGPEMLDRGYAPTVIPARLIRGLSAVGFHAALALVHRQARRMRGRP
jgi:hypothetical protein